MHMLHMLILTACIEVLSKDVVSSVLCLHRCMRTGRHPLLQGDYLVKKEQLRRVPQRAGTDAGPLRRLANRKDVMARVHGTGAEVPLVPLPLGTVRTRICSRATLLFAMWHGRVHGTSPERSSPHHNAVEPGYALDSVLC